eukprot:COSAG02_NODE_5233_length_4518_cov_1.661236_1_plen_143_part_00
MRAGRRRRRGTPGIRIPRVVPLRSGIPALELFGRTQYDIRNIEYESSCCSCMHGSSSTTIRGHTPAEFRKAFALLPPQAERQRSGATASSVDSGDVHLRGGGGGGGLACGGVRRNAGLYAVLVGICSDVRRSCSLRQRVASM